MNRLDQESSLYLRQHADNPVHWQPWDDTALEEARERDVPILLSIGYSACHWCHVMAHESFEDEETAELMNRHFVNIKVDREERPDLDRIYQLAHQLLSGRGGGWPLTVFLDPKDHTPFFAGTYFPLQRRQGMPSFKEVLSSIHKWFKENRDELSEQNDRVQAALAAIYQPSADAAAEAPESTATDLIQKGAQQIHARLDRAEGGYGGAPKFPQAPLLDAIAGISYLESGEQLQDGLAFTLEKMARGGLRDHLDGGFFRYCVDANWTIPHFEKMLYDNAMLLPLYAEGAERWKHSLLASSAEGIADWLTSVMRQDSGGYAASIDADAGGREGGFHVWTRDEVSSLLEGQTLQIFVRAYGLDDPPNFESEAWHLVRKFSKADLAQEFGESREAIGKRLESARQTLFEARERRVHPTLDEKQLTSWNALAAGGFLRAGRAMDRQDWMDRGEEILGFIRDRLWTGDGLMAVFNAGEVRFRAYLDDHAWLLSALMLSLQARWRSHWLDFAVQVADRMLDRFEDEDNGGFWFSDEEVEVPITRSMIFQDDATPAGNASAILALNRLGRLLAEPRYLDAAERCANRAIGHIAESPAAFPSMLAALRDAIRPPPHLIIGGRDRERQQALGRWVDDGYRIDCYQLGEATDDLPEALSSYRSDKPLTAWLCHGTHCLPPVNSREALQAQLEQ